MTGLTVPTGGETMNARTALSLLAWALCLGPALAGPPCSCKDRDNLPPCPPPCEPAATAPCAPPCPPWCKPPEDGPRGVVEGEADFLLWWTKSTPTPPLVTTSAPTDLAILGAATTTP
ncbi:MAG TPA: hypothetical protein VKD72_18935, partial [Gemmataceae bacterium]|nr:hypothetical protein [Gemmataceae bacterium]